MAKRSAERPFSKKWMFVSMGVFIAFQLLLGGLVAGLFAGRYVSIHLRFTVEAILNLSSYFAGGVLIGLVSPGVRIAEPAVGAALSLALMFTVTVFTPLSFISFSLTKLVLGGIVAFALALAGARLGERFMGHRV